MNVKKPDWVTTKTWDQVYNKQGVSAKGLLVLETIHKFPGFSKHSLAKKLFEENPHLFNSLEQVRSQIRYYTGTLGEKARKVRRLS